MRRISLVVPDLEYSGRVRRAALLAQFLPRETYSCSLHPLLGSGNWESFFRAQQIDVQNSSTTFRLIPNFWEVRKDFAQADIVHLFGWETFTRWALRMGLRKFPRIILSVDERDLRQQKLSWLSRQLQKLVSHFIVLHEGERQRWIGMGVQPDKISVVPPGAISLTDTSEKATGLRQQLSLSQDTPLIVTAGSNIPVQKMLNAGVAFDLLRQSARNLHRVVIGDLSSGLARLEYQVNRLILEDIRAHFIGGRPDVPSLLPQANVVWVPHIRWGGMQITLEAMMAGRPVVAYHRPALASLLTSETNGLLVPEKDMPRFAGAALRLLRNPSEAQEIGKAAQQIAQTHFSAQTMAERTAEVYDRLMQFNLGRLRNSPTAVSTWR